MAFLNLDSNYFEHSKTLRLIGILGPMADVFPIRLFAYCAKFHPNGKLDNYSDEQIEGVIKFFGESKKAVTALNEVDFIFKTEKGYAVTDWKKYQGHIIAFSRRAKKANKERWSRIKKRSLRTPYGQVKDKSVPIRTVPICTVPNLTEVTEYCKERGNAVDPQRWYDHYAANGWVVGSSKAKMRDWRAAVRTWERNARANGTIGTAKGPQKVVGMAAPVPGKYAHLGENNAEHPDQ